MVDAGEDFGNGRAVRNPERRADTSDTGFDVTPAIYKVQLTGPDMWAEKGTPGGQPI